MMKKGVVLLFWIIFLLVIPSLYMILKYFFPQSWKIEILIIYAPYLLSVITIMYKVDIHLYLLVKRLYLQIFGSDTSWLFSIRYSNIIYSNDLFGKIEKAILHYQCKIIKHEDDCLIILWDNTNILNLKIEYITTQQTFDLHFYTSKIDVPYKSISKKISLFSHIFEIVENNIEMIDRSKKQYEIQIYYSINNPYYSYWIKTAPREKIKSFNCSIYDNENSIIKVNTNNIQFSETSMPGLFFKIRNYLKLRGL